MKLCLPSAFAVLILCGPARSDDMVVKGQVTDGAGKPVAGAELASFWMADGNAMKAHQGVSTDAQGGFSFKFAHYGQPVAVLALDKDRKTGGLFTVDPKAPPKAVTLKVQPLVRVQGSFFCKEMNFKPTWTNVYMMTPDGARFLECGSDQAIFSFLLPPGAYKFWGYGTDIRSLTQDMTFAADKPLVDLKTLEVLATPIAKHKGKAPPKWHLTDARGVKKEVSLEDYKGKWVLVDFFTHWCGPCVARSLPNLIDLYEDHKDHRDKFEILAFHVEYAKDLKDYDEKIKSAKKKYWQDKELPFPLLLDATKQTIEAFGIESFPTTILIDPEGKLVGRVGEDALEQKLPPLASVVRVPRALDRMLTLVMHDQPLQQSVALLARKARVDIRLDEAALKAAGVAPGAKVPLQLAGALTLRSWLNLVLAAHNLTFKTDDKGILITAKSADSAAPKLSGPQEMCAKRIADRLDKKESFAFQDAPLSAVVQHFEQLTEENFVLDPAARKAGKLHPDTKISGGVKDLPLREGLQKLLDPLGLTILVRDEVVIVTPKIKP
jgi:thiol-disulfide isomerase/thioredoxin